MILRCLILASVMTLTVTFQSNSQCLTLNLIKNPGLEDYSCCPYQPNMIDCADFWTQPLPNSTSEYLNACAIDSLIGSGDFYHYLVFHSYFGNGYAGIINYGYNSTIPPTQYREYIQGTLSFPLQSGQCYYCQFWIKLFNYHNEYSFCGIDALGIYFSDTIPTRKDTISEMAMFFPAQINNLTGRVLTDTSEWTMISDTFIAKGGERFFTVGTFKQENEINKIYIGTPNTNTSYYFFDNFSLCPCSDTVPPPEPANSVFIPNVFSPNDDGSNDIFYVKGENIAQISMKVFNRWGNLVFESNDPAQGWDGRFHSKECAVGVYFYTASVTFINGVVELKSGDVTILR